MADLITINKASPALSPSTFASQPSFLQRVLSFSFQLNPNPSTPQPATFATSDGVDTGADVVNLSGYRSECRITNATAPGGSYCEAKIFGMSQSLMNQLAAVGPSVNSINRNNVTISAGAASNASAAAANASQAPLGGFPVAFGGTIYFAFGDYNNMPDVPFRFSARSGLFEQVQSAKPASYQGPTSIVSIMQAFADQLGVPLENNGVNGNLQNPYYPGTLMQQIYRAAEHADIFAMLVDGGTKLAIWPKTGFRTSQQASPPLISPSTGMIGYPTFGQNSYLYVRALYNPDVLFKGPVEIQSSIPQAQGLWTVQKMDLILSSLMPSGDWMMVLQCWPATTTTPAPPSVT